MKTMDYLQQPQAIEDKSFVIIGDIIRETRPDYRFASPLHEAIIKRVIHTTADFDWLDILWFSPDALESLGSAIRSGCTLYTDTTMALSGINKTLLAKFGGEVKCYISDPRVVRKAKEAGITRSMAAVDLALSEEGEKSSSSVMPPPRCSAYWSKTLRCVAWLASRSGLSVRQNRKMRWWKAGCRALPRWGVKAAAMWRRRSLTPFYISCGRRNERRDIRRPGVAQRQSATQRLYHRFLRNGGGKSRCADGPAPAHYPSGVDCHALWRHAAS
jgi:hypothetical protein